MVYTQDAGDVPLPCYPYLFFFKYSSLGDPWGPFQPYGSMYYYKFIIPE